MRTSFQRPYVPFFIPSPRYALPSSSALHRVSAALLARSISPTILFFHRGPFFFFTRPPSSLYMVCIYFTARRKTSRYPPTLAGTEPVLFPPGRAGDYHPHWARTLSRSLSLSWSVPAGYKPSGDNIEIRNACPRVKVAYEQTRWCGAARPRKRERERALRAHTSGIARFTVFM